MYSNVDLQIDVGIFEISRPVNYVEYEKRERENDARPLVNEQSHFSSVA